MLALSSQVTHTDYISQVLCLKQASSSTLSVKCLQRPWVSLKILRSSGNPSAQSSSLATSVHWSQQAVCQVFVGYLCLTPRKLSQVVEKQQQPGWEEMDMVTGHQSLFSHPRPLLQTLTQPSLNTALLGKIYRGAIFEKRLQGEFPWVVLGGLGQFRTQM